MVGIETVQLVDMQGDAAMRRKCLKELAHQFGIKRADLAEGQIKITDQIGACGQIQRTADLCVVHRQMAAAIAADPTLVAQGLRQRLAKGNAHILNRVVIIDMQIAGRPYGHVNQRMARQLIQHVVKETHTGLVVIGASAIKVDGDIKPYADRPLTPEQSSLIVRSIMNDKQAKEFDATKECNFAIAPPNMGRYRCNAFVQQNSPGLVVRTITTEVPDLDTLALPA